MNPSFTLFRDGYYRYLIQVPWWLLPVHVFVIGTCVSPTINGWHEGVHFASFKMLFKNLFKGITNDPDIFAFHTILDAVIIAYSARRIIGEK